MFPTKPPDPAQTLILESIHPIHSDRILLLEGGDGWLAANVAELVPDGKVLSLDRDVRKVRKAKIEVSHFPNVEVDSTVLPPKENWDMILMTIPKGRRFARLLLIHSWKALTPGGKLILAGPTRAGAKAVIKDAKRLFGNGVILGYRSHQRVAQCRKEGQLPIPLPIEFQQEGIAPGTTHFLEVRRPEGILKFETHPGIFSWETLDEGTSLLLKTLVFRQGSNVWDVGCGYGAIGLSAALAGAEIVWMNDINLLAVDYAQQNAVRNRLEKKAAVFPGDVLEMPKSTHPPPDFDLIVSNPAFHQGHKVDKSMADSLIQGASRFLRTEGRLVLVANRFLNYDLFMRTHFKRVERIAETNKYHIIQALR
jgi:16S rRNA (guanine1207-N2)-methyltransferase